MQDFVAIDFETANGRRSSVCAVGIVVVRGGEIVDKYYSLIKPSPNYYTYWTTQVHGLTREDTDDKPQFPEVWAQIRDRISGLPLVAHNRLFDESCLKAVFHSLPKTPCQPQSSLCSRVRRGQDSKHIWRRTFGVCACWNPALRTSAYGG